LFFSKRNYEKEVISFYGSRNIIFYSLIPSFLYQVRFDVGNSDYYFWRIQQPWQFRKFSFLCC